MGHGFGVAGLGQVWLQVFAGFCRVFSEENMPLRVHSGFSKFAARRPLEQKFSLVRTLKGSSGPVWIEVRLKFQKPPAAADPYTLRMMSAACFRLSAPRDLYEIRGNTLVCPVCLFVGLVRFSHWQVFGIENHAASASIQLPRVWVRPAFLRGKDKFPGGVCASACVCVCARHR